MGEGISSLFQAAVLAFGVSVGMDAFIYGTLGFDTFIAEFGSVEHAHAHPHPHS